MGTRGLFSPERAISSKNQVAHMAPFLIFILASVLNAATSASLGPSPSPASPASPVPTKATPMPPPTPTTGLIDQVEGDYVQSSPPASNDWHHVSISKKEENVFTWKNKAGVEWDLVFSGEERDGGVIFKVGDNCLYKKDGYTEALLSARGDSIEIKGPD